MKNKIRLTATLMVFLGFLSIVSAAERWVTQNAHIDFFSSTPAEDIKANNDSVVVILDSTNETLGFSVPMQAFEFEKALMQKHFNQDKFLDTKKYPHATFKGKIKEADSLGLGKTGEYEVTVAGTMSIRGIGKEISEVGIIKVMENAVHLDSEFDIVLENYGIIFNGGKPAKNIAKVIKIKIDAKGLSLE